jgi:hypothetical protein
LGRRIPSRFQMRLTSRILVSRGFQRLRIISECLQTRSGLRFHNVFYLTRCAAKFLICTDCKFRWCYAQCNLLISPVPRTGRFVSSSRIEFGPVITNGLLFLTLWSLLVVESKKKNEIEILFLEHKISTKRPVDSETVFDPRYLGKQLRYSGLL